MTTQEPVFLQLGQKPEEKGLIVREGARGSYPADVSERLGEAAEQIIARYPESRSALLPLLHLVQSEDGCITPAGIDFCARHLGLSGAEVAAVATFYSMYRRTPTGDYHVGVCTNTLCAVMGGDMIFAELKKHLGIGHGETTADGKVTLEHIECNAACDYAPVMMINWEFFDDQTPQSAKQIVDDLRSGKTVTPTRGAPLCTFRETARILAGFPDPRPGALDTEPGGPTLIGLRIARERGMEAPEAPDRPTLSASRAEGTEPEAAARTADAPAPAPSATVPPESATSETSPDVTDAPEAKGE
ncbi:NADH-quinone oxidoreductase subunit NuoE [Hoyosella altamirensis]|uniref:NADH-quinone oxidoreductase subunit E n=1 Tax=Hoyosella altamirensis TaxID=616997 RepID=A0A839RMU3_9ACTN|nr:NADH-quinone oxidoreductase subunit NuoE [Hoyosella altamirensis]MBB3038272.1 NADH-quinone oxidoreductase subunit E [Hoyosella altamirensis]